MSEVIDTRREEIINGGLWKTIILLSIPLFINNFINAAYNFIDTLFVANIGGGEVAAITFVGPLNTLVIAIGDGLAIGGTFLIARKVGNVKYKEAKEISLQLIGISIILGIIVSIMGFLFSENILRLLKCTKNLMPVAHTYFKLTILSSPFLFINTSYIGIKRAEGDTLTAMYVNFGAVLLKILLTYIFIFKLNFGIKSLAYSTIIASVCISVFATYDMFYKISNMKLSFKNFKFNSKVLYALFIIAIPVILEKSSISYGFLMVNQYVIAYGEKVLAAYGITNKINSLAFSSVTGFGTALVTIISQNLGANQIDRAKEAVKKTMIISISVSIVVIVCILIFKVQIATLFAKEDTIILSYTINAMTVYSSSVVAWAIFQVVIGVFQGSGYTKYSLYISLTRLYIFRLPIVIVFSNYTNLGEYSIWYAMLFSNILTAIFSLIFYFKTNWAKTNLKIAGE
ncbi:MATE family efflux transporter [Clostridium sediminicola]|uniref:MATE family efflux transporter n=1 Tax=Clostridium sediminicola TaxID=3114879 RepID=UPI0031F26E25